MLRLTQFTRVIRSNARNQGIVFVGPRIGCKLLGQIPVWRLCHTENCFKIKFLHKLAQHFRWLTRYRTVTLLTYLRRPVVAPKGGQSVALGGYHVA